MESSGLNIVLSIVGIIFSLFAIGITAWIFAFFFDAKANLQESKKQTALLKAIAAKNGVSEHDIEIIETKNR